VRYSGGESDDASGHESATRDEIARKIAALKGYDFAREYDPSTNYGAASMLRQSAS
jgi:hypothetical protein